MALRCAAHAARRTFRACRPRSRCRAAEPNGPHAGPPCRRRSSPWPPGTVLARDVGPNQLGRHLGVGHNHRVLASQEQISPSRVPVWHHDIVVEQPPPLVHVVRRSSVASHTCYLPWSRFTLLVAPGRVEGQLGSSHEHSSRCRSFSMGGRTRNLRSRPVRPVNQRQLTTCHAPPGSAGQVPAPGMLLMREDDSPASRSDPHRECRPDRGTDRPGWGSRMDPQRLPAWCRQPASGRGWLSIRIDARWLHGRGRRCFATGERVDGQRQGDRLETR